MCPLTHHVSCSFLVKHRITQLIQLPYSPDLVPCDFWLFPKRKSPLKGESLQAVSEIQENMTEQLMGTGRTLWGPKVPTFNETEASLSYVRCFLSCIFSNKCLYLSYCMTGHLLGRPLICIYMSMRMSNLRLQLRLCLYPYLSISMSVSLLCSCPHQPNAVTELVSVCNTHNF